MDNLTHALAGIVTAEVIVQVRASRGAAIDARWHRASWLISAAAHNTPDLDFAYTWITGGKLGYLLHHRGHTHTLVLAPLMAAIAYAIVWAWARRGGRPWTRGDHLWAILIAGLGPIGHILLDLSNNYGVHPLWPVLDRWFAGDTIFIVEPLFWAVTIPTVIFGTSPPRGRIAWGVILAAGLALPWLSRFFGHAVPIASALACTAIGAGTLALASRLGPRGRAALALGASLAVLATFATAGARAEHELREAIAVQHPDRAILDVARAPMPGTPACWEMQVVSRSGDRYQIALARVALAPSVISLDECARARWSARTAPIRDGSLATDRARIESELDAPVADVARLAARCDGSALLRFLRAPYLLEREHDLVAGDLRYDREAGLGFAELELPRDPPARCPEHVPPWEPWRARDLLE